MGDLNSVSSKINPYIYIYIRIDTYFRSISIRTKYVIHSFQAPIEDGKLDFSEFFLGTTAADPQTVHILNSFTGKERACFTFDFYDVNRSALEAALREALSNKG